MKRFWLVLLSLGLVMAFSVSAFAVDVKVSAEYYAAGLYLNKTSVLAQEGQEFTNPSTAFFYQRLRVGTDFVVSPCLKLVTRFDAMERIWGGTRSNPFYSDPGQQVTDDEFSAGSRAESENIAFDLAYIEYVSPVGLFRVGYQPDYVWGTVFADRATGTPVGTITYAVPVGPLTVEFQYAKEADRNYSYLDTNMAGTDADYDSYRLGAIYKFKGGEAGGLLLWNRDARAKGGFPGGGYNYLTNVFALDPYVKAKIGPVNVQAEVIYFFGDAMKWEDQDQYPNGYSNIGVSALSVFLDANANFGMFNVGGSFVYLSGDDPSTTDKLEGGDNYYGATINTAGLDWNPCLILFNNDLNYWTGGIYGHNGSSVTKEMSNAWFFQGRVGVKPTPALDVTLALSYAMADKKPNFEGPSFMQFNNGGYGTEIDLTGNYKLTNNLNYMLGVGYLFTGDYFKGVAEPGNTGRQTENDFIVINKLTLSF